MKFLLVLRINRLDEYKRNPKCFTLPPLLAMLHELNHQLLQLHNPNHEERGLFTRIRVGNISEALVVVIFVGVPDSVSVASG